QVVSLMHLITRILNQVALVDLGRWKRVEVLLGRPECGIQHIVIIVGIAGLYYSSPIVEGEGVDRAADDRSAYRRQHPMFHIMQAVLLIEEFHRPFPLDDGPELRLVRCRYR